MWLSCSSVGRKFVMALTGAFLVLFVTFHCLMNAVAICWPTAYNQVCEFLGANWYAIAGSAVLALFIIIHIIYAVMLTVQNRKARGSVRYEISVRPKNVEWSSKNMFVLGIVIFAFLVIHLINFWAKMQLQELRGGFDTLPPAAGTLFLNEAFSQIYVPIVYIIAFIALWFHMNHGFWSMFQSIGWDNNRWIPRLKTIGCWWVSIVCVLFTVQAIVFTVRANQHYYLTNEALREQYKEMIVPMLEKDFGPEGQQIAFQVKLSDYQQVSMGLRQMEQGIKERVDQMNSAEGKKFIQDNPQMKEQLEGMTKQAEVLGKCVSLFDYLEQYDKKPENPLGNIMNQQ